MAARLIQNKVKQKQQLDFCSVAEDVSLLRNKLSLLIFLYFTEITTSYMTDNLHQRASCMVLLFQRGFSVK